MFTEEGKIFNIGFTHEKTEDCLLPCTVQSLARDVKNIPELSYLNDVVTELSKSFIESGELDIERPIYIYLV